MRAKLATALIVVAAALPLLGGSIAGFKTAPINYAGVLYDATLGPDGNTWFTDNVNDTIGRIDGAGNITTFPLAKGTHPMYITSGADGNLWFSAGNTRIGRMSTVGFFTDFATNAHPGKIAPGPDGAVWFLDAVFSKLYRVATDGTMTNFSLGGDSAVDLIAGPDGNLWIADYTASALLKFSPSKGQIAAKYPAGPQGYAGDRLVVGPDGAIWFTHGDAIERMTVDGTLTSFPASPNSFPFSLTVGGDGNLWFGEYSSQRIGQVVIPKGGGSPTINESDSIGYGPGLIIAVPSRRSGSGKIAAPTDDCSSPCPGPTFVVGLDKGTASPGANIMSVTGPPPNTCADLSGTVQSFSYPITSQNTQLVAGIDVKNAGPDSANGVTVKVAVAYSPFTVDKGNFDTAATDGSTVTLTSSSLPCGVTLLANIKDGGPANLLVYANTPDPNPANNYSFFANSIFGRDKSLPQEQFQPVNGIVKR